MSTIEKFLAENDGSVVTVEMEAGRVNIGKAVNGSLVVPYEGRIDLSTAIRAHCGDRHWQSEGSTK